MRSRIYCVNARSLIGYYTNLDRKMSKPKQARIDSFFSSKTRDQVPEPLGQKITPATSTAPISNCTNFLNQSYESEKNH